MRTYRAGILGRPTNEHWSTVSGYPNGKMKLAWLGLAIPLVATQTWGEALEGRVVGVIDGDTYRKLRSPHLPISNQKLFFEELLKWCLVAAFVQMPGLSYGLTPPEVLHDPCLLVPTRVR